MIARIGWGVAAVGVASWLALVEVFWLPLRVLGVYLPVSVVAAVVGNLLLTEVTHRLTGSRLAAALPALAWTVVAVAALIRRPEGDLVLVGTGAAGVVNQAFLLLGVVAAAFGAGRALAGPRLPPVRLRPHAAGAPTPAGSGTGGAR